MLKFLLLSIGCVMIGMLFRDRCREYGTLLGLACGLLLVGFGFGKVQEIIEKLRQLTVYMGEVGGYFPLLLKVLGITYLCEFSAGLCKDAGYLTVANQIELLGKVSVMIAGMPVVFAVIDQFRTLL